jgi:hypothetical protein
MGYTHLSRCQGHQATVTHLDWSLPLYNPPAMRGRQGLPLVNFSAQPEPFFSLKFYQTTQRIPQMVLASS